MAITIKTISNAWDKACFRVHCESADFGESKEPQVAYIRLTKKQSECTADNEVGLMLDDQMVASEENGASARVKQLSWAGGGPNGVDTNNAAYPSDSPMLLGRAWMGRCENNAEAAKEFEEHVLFMSDTGNHFNWDGNFLIADVEPEKQGNDIYFECYGIIDIWFVVRKSGYVADNGKGSSGGASGEGGEGGEGSAGGSSSSSANDNAFAKSLTETMETDDNTRVFYDC